MYMLLCFHHFTLNTSSGNLRHSFFSKSTLLSSPMILWCTFNIYEIQDIFPSLPGGPWLLSWWSWEQQVLANPKLQLGFDQFGRKWQDTLKKHHFEDALMVEQCYMEKLTLTSLRSNVIQKYRTLNQQMVMACFNQFISLMFFFYSCLRLIHDKNTFQNESKSAHSTNKK